jgi:RsiW-degrading membrane proteinase PrsW (M82 family)
MRDAHVALWPSEKELTVTRSNILYLIIGALVIAVAVLGYQLYQDRHQPQGVHIDVGPNGLSIEKK